jgi:hypothetical protein
VPLAVTFAHGKTGTRLLERFGRDGLLVWVCYLGACKRNWIQGRLTYTCEPDGWMKLGLLGYEPGFTLAEFFAFTGRLKQTRRSDSRRGGSVVEVFCTNWQAWNLDASRESDAERKARERQAQDTRTTPALDAHYARTTPALDAHDTRTTPAGHTQNPRSEVTNTRTLPGHYADDTRTLDRTENYTEKERGLKPLSPSKVEGGNNGHAPSSGATPPPSRGSLGRVPSEVREVRPKLTPSQRAEAWVRNTGWDDPHIRHHLATEIEGLDQAELERLITLGAEIAAERA